MSKLFTTRESLVYPPEIVQTDPSWSYIHSYTVRPSSIADLDAKNYKFGVNVATQQQMSSQQQSALPSSQKFGKKEQIEKFASVIDTEDKMFEKQKVESLKLWENQVQNLCISMNRSIDAFYDRKSEVYEVIAASALQRRDEFTPQVDIKEMNEELKDLALAPWHFQSLPGTKVSTWPESLPSLIERLNGLKDLDLWQEPLDIINGGQEFFEQAKAYILSQITPINEDPTNEFLQKNTGLAFVAYLKVCLLHGEHQYILEALDTFIQFSSDCQHSDKIYLQAQDELKAMIPLLMNITNNYKPMNHLQPCGIHGVISLAQYISFVSQNETNSSITTDGTYIYLYIGITQRGCMYKIGTGENNSIAGKIYLSQKTDREGDVTWVYCQGKLYSRRANEDLHTLQVIDPLTFKTEGSAKLFCGEGLQSQTSQSINRYYPLLTDGKGLFIVTMNIAKKRRKVKESCRQQYKEIQEKKQKTKEQDAILVISSALKKKQKKPSNRKKEELEVTIQQDIAKFKDYLASEDSKEKERIMKELKKQNLTKEDFMKKVAEQAQLQKQQQLKQAQQKDGEKKEQPPIEPDEYKVCEFFVQEFDVSNQGDDDMSITELLQNEDVLELFESFSGFYSYQECYRALKFNNSDVSESALWLVDEGEKERGKKSLQKKRQVLICEAEIISENQSKKNELDIVVRQDSLLLPTNISCGKWIVQDEQITYHSLTSDNGYAKIFSLNSKDSKIIENEGGNNENLEEKKTATLSATNSLVIAAPSSDLKQPTSELSVDYFEEVQLQTTLLKTIKYQQRTQEFAYSSYITYDFVNKQYYLLLLGQNQRHIGVAKDLLNFDKNLSPNRQIINENIDDIKSFVYKILECLNNIELKRFQMPWRWNYWSNTYIQILQQWGLDYLEQSDAIQDRSILEHKKKVMNKLTNRLEKVGIREKQIQREKFDLSEEKEQDLPLRKKSLVTQSNTIEFTSESMQDLVLPKEQICIQKEVKKIFALCIQGNESSLKIIMRLLDQENESERVKIILNMLQSWVIYSNIVISQSHPQLLEEVGNKLLKLLEESNEHLHKIWRICILGWSLFFKTLDKQARILELLVKECTSNRLQELTNPQQINSNYFYQLLEDQIHPIKLFYLKNYYYPAPFFIMEVLQQSRIQSSIILIDKGTHPIIKDQKKQETNQICPYYHKYFNKIDCFNGYQRVDMSLKNVSEYYEKEVTLVNINHNFFTVPLHVTFIQNYKTIEDLNSLPQLPPLKNLIHIYTSQSVEHLNVPNDPKETHHNMLQFLNTLRQNHEASSTQLINLYKSTIASYINPQNYDERMSPFLLKTVQAIIYQVMSHFDITEPSYSDFTLDILKYISENFEKLVQITNQFQNLHEKQIQWFKYQTKILSTIINMMFPLSTSQIILQFAYKSLPYMLKIFEQLKLLFCYTKKEDDGKLIQILEKTCQQLGEGTDFSNEKIFETPHPYSKGESFQKEVISNPKAIAFSIEFDKRCQTEYSSDYLVLSSQDHAYWVNDNFGTNIRFYGKPQIKYPFLILGNKLTIEFRSLQHSKNKAAARGGRGRGRARESGGEGQERNNHDEVLTRWGFRLIVRPIYGETTAFFNENISADVLQQLTKKMGSEEHSQYLVNLMNQMTFLSSLFSRTLTKANQIDQKIEQSAEGETALTALSFDKYMPWQLFKCGIRDKEYDKPIHETISLSIDQKILKIEEKNKIKCAQLEEFQPQQQTDEQKQKAKDVKENQETEPKETFTSNSSMWSPEVRDLYENKGLLEELLKTMRDIVPYTQSYLMEKKRPNFLIEYQDEWNRVELLILINMFYHSNSIEDIKKMINDKSQQYTRENLRLIGIQINEVITWMQSRLQGQQGFQNMLRDVIDETSIYIEEYLEKREKIEEEKRKEQAILKEKEEKELKEKQEKEQIEKKEKEEQVEQVPQKKGPIVSKEGKLKVKRKKVIKIAQPAKKKQKKGVKKQPELIPNLQEEEEKKQEEEVKVEKKKPLFTPTESKDIKNKVYNKVYDDFLQLYQGNYDRVKPLCQFLDIIYNPEDPNDTLKQIFKKIKSKLKEIIDFDGDTELIKENIQIDKLQLQSPYKEICKDVEQRMLFLLEIKCSISYSNKVIQSERCRATHIKNKLSRMTEDSQYMITDEKSIDDGDSDHSMLEPLGIQRSQSVQVGLQPMQSQYALFNQVITNKRDLAGAVIDEQSSMKERDMADWVDNYRKWRQWQRYHSNIKGVGYGGVVSEEDLKNIGISPLYGVVAFAKATQIVSLQDFKQQLINQKMKGAMRYYGLQVQEMLYKCTQNTPFQRFVLGNLSSTLNEHTFYKVENCGETFSRYINQQNRVLIKLLMENVIQARIRVDQIIQSYSRSYQSQKENQEKSKPLTKQQQQNTIEKQQMTQDDWQMYDLIKKLLHTLNDIRVMLNNVYTIEYVLEIFRSTDLNQPKINSTQTQQYSTSHQMYGESELTGQVLKNFLKSIVQFMLLCQGSSPITKISPLTSKIINSVAQCTKVILTLFMTDKSKMLRSNETQRIIQEVLIDTIVQLMEKICGFHRSKKQTAAAKPLDLKQLGRPHYQEELVQLLKLLSEIMRISKDNEEEIVKDTTSNPDDDKISDIQRQQYFLSEGSPKVMRCAQILTFLLHNIEVPIVTRQIIRCAKLFFNLVDFKELQLHQIATEIQDIEEGDEFKDIENSFLKETFLKLGQKVSNPEQIEKEEKLYVIYANINSSEEDFSFLLTALYHWESLHPTFTLQYSKDPNDIVVKTAKKEEVPPEGDHTNAQKILQQIAEIESNNEIQELIQLQMAQQNQKKGKAVIALAAPKSKEPTQMSGLASYYASKNYSLGGKFGFDKNVMYYGQSATTLNSIGLTKLEQIYDEIVKSTWEDGKEDDTQEEKERKLMERNYNQRIQTHLKDSIQIALALYSRYSCPISDPLPLKKAIQLSNILQKAYKGQLEPIQMNPYLKTENKDKKMPMGKSVSEMFPFVMKTIDSISGKKSRDLAPGHGPPILIAPKQLVVSLSDSKVSTKYEAVVETKIQALRNLEKNPNDGFNCNVIQQGLRRQGGSIQSFMQIVVELIRNLANKSKKQQLFKAQIGQIVQKSLELLSSKDLSKISMKDKQIILGTMIVLGAWNPQIKTGLTVTIEENNKQRGRGIVLDEGIGKKRVSVLVENQGQLSIIKVAHENIKPIYKESMNIMNYINQQQLSAATINVYAQVKQTQSSDNSALVQDSRFFLLMLLKLCSSIGWNQSVISNYSQFVEILYEITQQNGGNGGSEEDKTKAFWEKQVTERWEDLIDKCEINNQDYFVPRENFLSSSINQIKQKEAIQKEISPEKLAQAYKYSLNQYSFMNNEYQDQDYVQAVSYYLKGLQEPQPKKNQSEANLKLLAYWEKHIIPKIIEFVRTTYKPWEMELSFEQLRHSLRQGDSVRALEDAMTMCERKLPQGCVIPEESHDWTTKMIDECIVGSWALAKFKVNRQQSQQQQSINDIPIIGRMLNFNQEEFLIQIKCVDLRSQCILAEYLDIDTMQVHSIWVPVTNLNDLHSPIPPRSVGFKHETILYSFYEACQKTQQCYARETILQCFYSENKQLQHINLPSSLINLQDLISWSIWETYSQAPLDGWAQELHAAIPTKVMSANAASIMSASPVKDEESIANKLISIVEENAKEIVLEQFFTSNKRSEETVKTTTSDILMAIKHLFTQTILTTTSFDNLQLQKDKDIGIFDQIVDWCVLTWYQMAERIRQDRGVFDLCKEYDKYVSKESGNDYGKKEDDDNAIYKTHLLPLHELVPSDDHKGSLPMGTLLMFKTDGAHLTPTSKVQFYSDENKINLEAEINAGSEGKRDLTPLLLNHGKIWVNFDAGTTALLAKHLQSDQKSTLPCSLLQIPSAWPVCCWLTEVLTSTLILINREDKEQVQFALQSFQKVMGAMVLFYEEGKAPHMLKSIILQLLSRCVRKIRYLYKETDTQDETKTHIQQLFLSASFINQILSELLIQKEHDEQQLSNQGQQVLYSAFVQDCVEFLVSCVVPFESSKRINSHRDLLKGESIDFPEWMLPLIKTAYFMHYFSNEIDLPLDIIKEVHSNTILDHKQIDHLLVIKSLPSEDKYSHSWIKEEVIKIIKAYGARILDPSKDITFINENDQCNMIIMLDGFNPLLYIPEQEEDQVEEETSAEEDNGEQKEEEKKVEEEQPTDWGCPMCTLLNPIDFTVCDICQTPRPPMESIVAAFQEELQKREGGDQPNQDEKKDEEKKKEKYMIKLDNMAKEISNIVKKEEKRIIKEQKQKELEEKKKKEEEELKLKQQEEAAKKQKQLEEAKNKIEEKPKEKISQKKKNDKKNNKGKKKQKDDEELPLNKASPSIEQSNANVFLQEILKQKSIPSIEYDDVLMPPNMKKEQAEKYIKEVMMDVNDEDDGEDSYDQEADNWSIPRSVLKDAMDKQKMIDLGIDPQLIEMDPDLALALVESMQSQKKDKEEGAKGDEEEKKALSLMQESQEALAFLQEVASQELANLEQQEKEMEQQEKEIEQQKKEEEIAEQKQEIKEELQKHSFTKLQVLAGSHQIFDDNYASRIVYQFLKNRLSNQEHLFTTVLNKDSIKLVNDQLLEDFEITKESLAAATQEEFEERMQLLMETDIKLFYKLIEEQGYDFWLQKVAYQDQQQLSKLTISMPLLEKLKQLVEVDMTKESKLIMSLKHTTDLRLLCKTVIVNKEGDSKPINYIDDTMVSDVYPEIYESLSQADFSFYWALLRLFNEYFAPSVPYFSCSRSQLNLPSTPLLLPLTLSTYMSFTRNLCLLNVKFELQHLILEKTSAQKEQTPKLFFERLKIANKNIEKEKNSALQQNKSQRKNESSGSQEFMFVQAHDQIREYVDYAMLRPKKPQGAEPHLAFQIVFKGEHVVGEGGPYRQFFADVSQELQPQSQASGQPTEEEKKESTNVEGEQVMFQGSGKINHLQLLTPTPNQKAGSNLGKDKYILSPSRTSQQDLQQYEFLGLLMGICMRTGAHLTLDLSSFVWKQLVAQGVSEQDLIEVDLGFWKLLQFMVSAKEDWFNENIDENWSVVLSDQEIYELKEGGKQERVEYQDRIQYVQEAVMIRMKESTLQCEAIRRGIIKIVPEALLNMVTWQELERWVCGKSFVDLELLQRHTKYGGDKKSEVLTEDSRRVLFFWQVLSSFSEEDKQKFIKFCWGQQRLPANDEEFERRQVRFMIKPAMTTSNQDTQLPRADTCFFNLTLPDYSSMEIMKQKILLAIRTDCDSMNAEAEHMNMVIGNINNGNEADQSYDEEY